MFLKLKLGEENFAHLYNFNENIDENNKHMSTRNTNAAELQYSKYVIMQKRYADLMLCISGLYQKCL